MDCSVVKTGHHGMFLLSTTDYFNPLVDEPYMQGRIAACNVLSDLYAMGVVEIDTVLMALGVCSKMSEDEKDIVTTEMIKGFNDLCKEAGTNVTGGQTTLNPWPIIGGFASSVCVEEEFVRPVNAVPGDVMILTKPLGTQITVNAMEWLTRNPTWWSKVSDVTNKETVIRMFNRGNASMSRLNRNGAKFMHTHGAHACTDVTGFGILGHAQNMAEATNADVEIILDNLPIIKGCTEIDDALGGLFKLRDGYSAETSGGLMIALPADAAEQYIKVRVAVLNGFVLKTVQYY
eukprot:TRINITY_DN3272_c0_g1_i4.p1 TRINITY_DN3272_c0_g1~~TRINITY_DN3272_c0_g1_i4.p1  ORF type:complete len:290 (+),score=90.23 TRINITY_DN3272_c0_g1_i4:185-1054(+)